MGTFLVAQTSQMSDLNFRGRNWCWDKVPRSLTRRRDAQWRGGKQKKSSKFMPKLKQAKGGRRVLARPSKLCQAKLQCFEKLEIFSSV